MVHLKRTRLFFHALDNGERSARPTQVGRAGNSARRHLLTLPSALKARALSNTEPTRASLGRCTSLVERSSIPSWMSFGFVGRLQSVNRGLGEYTLELVGRRRVRHLEAAPTDAAFGRTRSMAASLAPAMDGRTSWKNGQRVRRAATRAVERPSRGPRRCLGSSAEPGLTYRDAGVDIDAGSELVRRIAKMCPEIGGFSGLYPFGE